MVKAIYVAAACAIATVLSLHLFAEGVPWALRAPPTDIVVDWGGARVLLDGGNPYAAADVERAGVAEEMRRMRLGADRGLAHPPTAFVWFLPLASYSLVDARFIWLELTILLTCILCVVLARDLAPEAPLPTAALLFGAVASCSWYAMHLAVGQVSVPIALLVALAWMYLRRGADVPAGVMLGLACTFKTFPAALMLYLLFVGRLRAVIASAAAWLAVAIPTTFVVGLAAWPSFLVETGRYTDQWIGHVRNASLLGILQRLRHPACADPGPLWAPALAGAWLLSIAGIWLAARRHRRGDQTLGFAAATAWCVLTGPYAWEHYQIVLALPFAAAVALAVRAQLPFLRRAAAAAVVAATAILSHVDWTAASRAVLEYRRDGTGHFFVHYYEVANWLPAVLLYAALLALRPAAPSAGSGTTA
ncbi:MAG TPA: glycosyltransferase family 87 protein [Haliangiales bacterium]|nr:glycosyltransferase family 87 protein [Haliangiales bacterium]